MLVNMDDLFKEQSHEEKVLEDMIWDINWKKGAESLESETNLDKIRETFDYGIANGIADQIDFLRMNIRDFRVLKNEYPDILKKAMVTLFMTDVKEVSLDELAELRKGYNIQYMQIASLAALENRATMSVELVYKYKKAIMKLIDGIDDSFLKGTPDREKRIFGIVITKIIERVKYDKEYQEKIQGMYDRITDRLQLFRRSLHMNPSNEMVGLLNGRCVCRGYAGIVRDVFGELGIDTNVIIGVNPDIGEGHAWNQIKLDDQWYNMDVTWDIKYMKHLGKSYWLLKDDTSFEEGLTIKKDNEITHEAHKFFNTGRTPSVPCNKSLSEEELSKYIDIDKINKKLWLDRFVTNMEQKQKGNSR